MPFTNYASQLILTAVWGNATLTIPSTWYVALGTTATTPSQVKGTSPFWSFTEPSGSSYARVAVTNNTTNFGAVTSEPSAGYTIQNNGNISEPTSSGSWGTIGYIGWWDALTGGNLWAYASLTTNQAVSGSGVTLTWAGGSYTFNLD